LGTPSKKARKPIERQRGKFENSLAGTYIGRKDPPRKNCNKREKKKKRDEQRDDRPPAGLKRQPENEPRGGGERGCLSSGLAETQGEA